MDGRSPLTGSQTPNNPRVRTVGFSLSGGAGDHEDEPDVFQLDSGSSPSAPLPVIIPPAFQVCACGARSGHSRGVGGLTCQTNNTGVNCASELTPCALALPLSQEVGHKPIRTSAGQHAQVTTFQSGTPRPPSPGSPGRAPVSTDTSPPPPHGDGGGHAAGTAQAGEAGDKPRKGPPEEPKPKLSRAERREIQEAQRAAKAERQGGLPPSGAAPAPSAPAGGGGSSGAGAKGGAAGAASSQQGGDKAAAGGQQRKPAVSEAVQFDDKRVVAKLQKKSLVPRKESDRAIELFSHLPQFDTKSLQDALASTAFAAGASALHPVVMQLGCAYADGVVTGGRARCLALLRALRRKVADYTTPPEKALARDLTARINVAVQFLIDCRPLGVSMGNAIKSLKQAIASVGARQLSEGEAKEALLDHIDRYITERILLADKVIEQYALSKIADGDVILTHAASATVTTALIAAHTAGRRFRVVVVDSRPRLEGRATLSALLRAGISCTYAHSHAVSYVMKDVTKVFLGAAAVLGNGAVLSRVGTAAVAMVAHSMGAPVLVLAHTCKLHERTQLDSITNNELGDPTALASVSGRPDVTFLADWEEAPRLRLLNLLYDVTPAEYVTMIVTEVGMLPPTSVPVVLREYRREAFQ